MRIKPINLAEKFNSFHDYWNPKVVGKLNNQLVKVAKLKGAFVMHKHDNEDELFLVTEGTLKMELDREVLIINTGEFVVIPRGTNHKPIAEDEVKVLLFEPESTLNTGNVENELTVKKLTEI
jgi:mannose-6-phosphate isomerase-like protein (cupin superfamily)